MRSSRVVVGDLVTYAWRPEHPARAVLVARTPYGAAGHATEAAGWSAHGVALVVQDVRGRHESPGEFVPYREDLLPDGPTLLAWVRSWAEAPVVLLGTSYGAHAALATAAVAQPDGVVVAVPALGLGETARTRGGVLQLASRLGWWLTHDVRRPWRDVLSARRHDAERAALAGRLTCPLLALGGTHDWFGHDTVDLWSAWGGPARLALGPWDHSLAGAGRARRILDWLDALVAREPLTGPDPTLPAPHLAVVHVDTHPQTHPQVQWCASLSAGGREVAHGAAHGPVVTLGPVVPPPAGPDALTVRLAHDDFPRYARSHRPASPVPDHHLELLACTP